MADDRHSFLHVGIEAVPRVADDLDLSFALPDETINVPAHLVPLYQDEEDDSILPTNSHPSYPYGNPYRATAASKLSSPFPISYRSLATSLPSLYLAQMGFPPTQQKWTDLGLDGVLPYEPPQEHVTAPSAISDEPRPTGHAQHTPAAQRNQGAPPLPQRASELGSEDGSDRSASIRGGTSGRQNDFEHQNGDARMRDISETPSAE